MSVSYDYDQHTQIINVFCTDELTIEEIFQYFSEIERDASIGTGAVELVDLAHVAYFNIDHFDVSTMPGHYESARFVKEIRGTILYGSSPFHEGLAELIKVHFNKATPEHCFITVSNREQAEAAAARLLEKK